MRKIEARTRGVMGGNDYMSGSRRQFRIMKVE
jgi:hypothetical protein